MSEILKCPTCGDAMYATLESYKTKPAVIAGYEIEPMDYKLWVWHCARCGYNWGTAQADTEPEANPKYIVILTGHREHVTKKSAGVVVIDCPLCGYPHTHSARPYPDWRRCHCSEIKPGFPRPGIPKEVASYWIKL